MLSTEPYIHTALKHLVITYLTPEGRILEEGEIPLRTSTSPQREYVQQAVGNGFACFEASQGLRQDFIHRLFLSVSRPQELPTVWGVVDGTSGGSHRHCLHGMPDERTVYAWSSSHDSKGMMVYRCVISGAYRGGFVPGPVWTDNRGGFQTRPCVRLQMVISGIARCCDGQGLRSHARRSDQFFWLVSASVSSTPEMRTPNASFLTLEGTRITPVCGRPSRYGL